MPATSSPAPSEPTISTLPCNAGRCRFRNTPIPPSAPGHPAAHQHQREPCLPDMVPFFILPAFSVHRARRPRPADPVFRLLPSLPAPSCGILKNVSLLRRPCRKRTAPPMPQKRQASAPLLSGVSSRIRAAGPDRGNRNGPLAALDTEQHSGRRPPSLPLQGTARVLTWRKLFTKSFICFTGGGFRPFFTSHREAAGKATIGGKASFPSVVLPSALP